MVSRPEPSGERRQKDRRGDREDPHSASAAKDKAEPHARATEVLKISHRALLYKINDYKISAL